MRNIGRIRIIDPLEVDDSHNLLNVPYLVLIDSGGIQEETLSIGKLALVLRDTTEKLEGVDASTLKRVRTNKDTTYIEFDQLLDDKNDSRVCVSNNTYGNWSAYINRSNVSNQLHHMKGWGNINEIKENYRVIVI